MGMLDLLTGGSSGRAEEAQRKAIEALASIQAPSSQQLTLPELQQYAQAQNMTPAQMQAFLQQENAYNKPVDQTGTAAQVAAINQLAGVANAGAEGSPTQRAQIAQVNQDAARQLAGQRGAIEQQAAARGVPVGLLQAALSSQQAGQGLQDAHMAALQSQGQNYQQALSAMAQGGALGGQLQGQQNAQANQVAQAQNAMQQFNAANQQNASQGNAANQQQANLYNTQAANQVGQANTGLANQRTQYNAQVPQQVYQNQLQKATGTANQYNQLANTLTGQGQQEAGLFSGLLGAGATVAGGMMGGPAGAMAGNQLAKGAFPQGDASMKPSMGYPTYQENKYLNPQGFARGGMVKPRGEVIQPYSGGGVCMPNGGMVPGEPEVPGDSLENDTVNAKLSPGELVVPRTQVPDVLGMMAQTQTAPPVHPQDVATLLMAMRQLRGAA
jgi:hypothetical protein